MLAPERLLDIARNFVVFERDAPTGKTIRKLCRYQQYAAVNKAVARTASAERPTDRGGVVWHTQGSGKSLTMLWLALKLRRDPLHENPTLVVVTDRKDLDDQITRTRCSPAVVRTFVRVTDRDDLEACVAALAPEEARAEGATAGG